MGCSVNCPPLLAVAAAVLAPSFAAAQAPASYVRKATWVESMIASRTAAANTAGAPTPVRERLPDFGTSDLTAMAWVKTRSGGTIFAKAPERGRWVRQGKALFVSGNAVVFDIGWVGAIRCRARVADGRWHHVALVARKGRQRIYVDGKFIEAGSLEGAADREDWPLKIGSAASDFGGRFSGSIDEARIYSRAMSDADVKRRFQAAPPADDRGLVAWWPFDGTGDDASGSLNPVSKMSGCGFAPGKLGKALKLEGRGVAMVRIGGEADPNAALWAQLRKDFPDPASRREMAWEHEDGIWGPPWEPGHWADLARRYATASERAAELASQAQRLARSVGDRSGMLAVRKLYIRSRERAQAMKAFARYNLSGIRKAVEAVHESPPANAARREDYLARLADLERRAARLAEGTGAPDAMARWVGELEALRRQALIADNPLIGADKLLFIRRYTYQSTHFYTDFIDGCEYYGGNICTLDLRTGEATDLVAELEGGIFGRFDLSFDATRIVFDWKPSRDKGFRLYEIGIDPSTGLRAGGSGLRQLTFEPPDEKARVRKYGVNFRTRGAGRNYNHHTDDIHPCYLPDGRIVFASSRCEYGTLCDAPDILSTTVLYRIDADGTNMVKLTNSAVSEFSPAVMNDGRVLYTRWEYVDKGQLGIKCLWAMRPDGSGTVEVFGNDIPFPPTLLHGRPIPGHNNLFVVLGTPHYPQSGIGTVIRLDINYPIRTREPMTYITPHVDVRQEPGWNHLVNGRWVRHTNGPLYMDPYPLSDKVFLVSHNPDKRWNDKRAYGLYLLDEFGNHVLIHKDPEFSCWQPTPLRPRRKPPAVPPASLDQPGQEPATVAMVDVYTGLPGIERGTIKHLRIMEQVPRPWACRHFWDPRTNHTALISSGPVLGLKVLHGVVPVYEDGSAYFTVPPDRNIYFEALDEDYMEVQRQRTYVNYRPGERRSCIGCHEFRQLAPANRYPEALKHPPSEPGPQPGETAPRVIHYPTDVQPILDRHCVKCHDGKKPKPKLVLTGELTTRFSRSYEEIMKRRLVRTTDEGSDFGGSVPVPPKTVGSHASRLIRHLMKGHQEIKLSREEMIKLVTWVDANAQYYGTYYGRQNLRYRDHPNFRPAPTFAQGVSTKAPLPEEHR